MKECKDCNIVKELSEFYSQEKSKSNGEKYIYHQPCCKKCVSDKHQLNKEERNKRSREYHEKNPQQRRDSVRKHRQKHPERAYVKLKKWQQKNRDRILEYRQRRINREHEITEEEWSDCKEYFNSSCAYCGITEPEAKEKYNNNLHREHVDHEGSNDISNCIPACKMCNSTKNTKDFQEWYNENNHIYSKDRYSKIVEWLLSFLK